MNFKTFPLLYKFKIINFEAFYANSPHINNRGDLSNKTPFTVSSLPRTATPTFQTLKITQCERYCDFIAASLHCPKNNLNQSFFIYFDMRTVSRRKNHAAITLLTAVLSLFPAYVFAEAPYIRLATGSGPLEQAVCTGAPIEPIVLEYGGDGVTTIEQGQKYMVPEKGNTIQGWRNDGLGFNNNTGTRQCTIDGTISGTANWLSANLTGSVTYNMTIRTVGGATNAEAIIQITVHPHLNEHQIKLVSTNCSQPANAAIVVMPGREPGTPPYKAKTSDMADWVDITDVCYVQGMTFEDGSPAFTGNLPAFYHIITSEAEVDRIRNNWDISIMDSNGCISGDPLQPNNIPTVDELDGQDITYTGQEYFDSKEENCKISITVHSAAAWRFTDQGDPDNMVANYPIVYVLKKKNENSGIFEETDRKWTTADMTDITFPDLEAGTYAVSTAFYDNPGNPEDKPWSNCTYDIPYGEPNGSVYEKDIAITGTPEVFDLTAPYGNGYCDDGTGSGADLQLSGSETGTSYQLYKDGTPIGSPIQGTGSAIDFGKQTEGLYTVIATKSGCTVDMAGEITITKKDAPAAPTVESNSLSFCNGGNAEIKVTNAVSGINYSLFKKSGDVFSEKIGSTIDGSDSDNVKWSVTEGGEYKVQATNSNGCSSESATITATKNDVPEAPEIYGISADNSIGYCADDANGADITVSNPINNVTYTLYQKKGDDFTEVENSAIKYDGSNSVKWSATEGEYKVVATNASECSSENAEGTIEIKAIPLPEKPGLTATYAACQNDTETKDLNELIHDKPGGYTVTWYDSNMVPLSDTNISLKDAGTQTFYATYTNTSGCESEKATIDIVVGASSAVPVVTDYDECAEEGILDLNSLVTLNRDGLHWFDSGMTPLDDTKTSIKKDEIGTSTYYVYNVDASGCKSEQTEVNVTIRPVPAAPVINIPDGGLSYCKGTDGAEIVVSNAVNGVTYTLYMVESSSDTQIAQEIASTDGSLSLGKHTAGTYTVVATNDLQCSTERADGDLVITELPLPASIGLIAPDGNGYCDGDAGVELQLPTSEAGIEYTLEKDGTVIGTFTGTGSAVELGLYEAGEYFVAATNPASGCSIRSQSAFSVEIMGKSAAPTVNTDYVEDGTFKVCAGENQSATLTTFVQNGDALNLTWYKDAGLTEPIPADEVDLDLSTEKDVTYYVTNTEDGLCESLPVLLRIVVNAVPSAPVAAEDPDSNGTTLPATRSERARHSIPLKLAKRHTTRAAFPPTAARARRRKSR